MSIHTEPTGAGKSDVWSVREEEWDRLQDFKRAIELWLRPSAQLKWLDADVCSYTTNKKWKSARLVGSVNTVKEMSGFQTESE